MAIINGEVRKHIRKEMGRNMEAETSAVEELVEAQTKIWDHSMAHVTTMTIQCAIELGIPEAVHGHGRPITLPQLTHALNISPSKSPFLYRVMRMLVHLGYFVVQKIDDDDKAEEEEADQAQEGYWMTTLSRLMLKENPYSATSFLLLFNHPILVHPFRHLSAWFRSNHKDDIVFELANGGKKIYEVTSTDAGFNRLFSDGMDKDSWLLSRALVVKCKDAFDGLNSLVDVGGSTGTTAKAIADHFPNIRCTVLDLPQVISSGLKGTDNLTYVAGDMFKDIPPADAVFFKWVMIDWSDKCCVEILKQSKKAITGDGKATGGKVMIADMVMGHHSCNDESSTGTLLLFDMEALALVEGEVRTEKQWAKLFSDAGFSTYTITPLCGLRVLIQVYP